MMDYTFNMKKDKIRESEELLIEERRILDEYKDKIFHNDFKIYHGFPLSLDDTFKCKVLERNLEYLKQVVFNNAFKNLGYDINNSFGVGDKTIVQHIPEHIPTRKKQQSYPFPFDDDFRQKLLKANKFKIHQSNKIGQLTGPHRDISYQSEAHYYVTEIEHQGKTQQVVIKVTIDYLNPTGGMTIEPYDYSCVNITALLGKKCKKVMSLARLDYMKSRAAHPHQNFLDENQNVIEFGHRNWHKHIRGGTHLHIQTEKFELLNPNCLGSGDALEVDDSTLGFIELTEKLLKDFNFYDLKMNFPQDTKIVDMYKILNKSFMEKKNEEFNK